MAKYKLLDKQKEFIELDNEEREKYFYKIREEYNSYELHIFLSYAIIEI